MSSRSHVFFAHKVNVKLPQHFSELLVSEFGAEILGHEEGTAYNIEDVKWYVDNDNDLKGFYTFLNELKSSDYVVIEACYDYPESNYGDAGAWYDNPWEARRFVRTGIKFAQ